MGLFYEIIDRHLGKILGVLLGLLFGWLAVRYGILKALFIGACSGAGYYIGKRADEKVDFKELITKIFRE